MGHVVREADWCVIDIDTSAGRVFLQERWQYTWVVRPPTAAWTLQEKRGFHRRADRAIWAAWSNRARLRVRGNSSFARRHSVVPINLDIRWVTSNPHWRVTVTKVPAGEHVTSSVRWTARTISLDTNDFTTRNICLGTPRVCTQLVPVAHEFGHAVGNTSALGRGDENPGTNPDSPHRADQGSIMHSGNQLRNRHFRTILEEMNRMIPGATFSVHSV